MVFVPNRDTDVIDRETALDSLRSLENLIWRYGGHSLECEIWAGQSLKGRISISVKVLKETKVVVSNTAAVADNR